VALDLAQVRQVDAGGLGELAFMLETVRHLGGRLTLIATPDRVGRMLSVTRLDRLFDGCEGNADLAAATRSTPRRNSDSPGVSVYA
jgi:anti-sigma B factor antagonist